MTNCGPLLIIGGAEDKKDDCVILNEFLSLSGGKGARIAVMAVATKDSLTVEHAYKRIFRQLGAGSCQAIHITERNDANDLDIAADIKDIDGIFFTGGDQLRITAMLGGTELYRVLHQAHAQGVVIAGTSAGAAVMSKVMIVDGENDKPPKKEIVNLSPGLGLVEGIVIDQHFAQRGRLGRLLSVVAYNPQLLGVGIDENTAVIVDDAEGYMKVIGEGAVTIVDGTDVEFSNVAAAAAEETLAVAGYRLHTLPDSYKFDLRTRRSINSGYSKEDNK